MPAILFARIGAAHGVGGEVRVKSFGDSPESLERYSPLTAADGRLFHVDRLRRAKEVLIVKFRGIDNRDAAQALNGVELYVDRNRFSDPEEEEFFHADLIGLAAFSEAGEALGAVVAVQNFGAGDIVEIGLSRGRSLLVPFTKAAVPLVDIATGRIVVAPPAEIEDDEPENEGKTA